MNINGVEFEFDISDTGDLKRYNDALKHYENRISSLKKIQEPLEIAEYGLSMIRDFFYEATGTDVTADVTSLRKAMAYYKEFLNEIKKQNAELHSMFDDEPAEKIIPSMPGKPGIYMGTARPPMKH